MKYLADYDNSDLANIFIYAKLSYLAERLSYLFLSLTFWVQFHQKLLHFLRCRVLVHGVKDALQFPSIDHPVGIGVKHVENQLHL